MKHEEVKRRNDYCIELAKNGHTFQEIADAVGISRDSVRQILARHGIKEYRNGRKPPAKIDKCNAIKLLQSGLMPKDVAKELGCATSTINVLAKKEGLSFEWRKNATYKNRIRSSGKRNKRKEQKHEEIRAYKAEGHTNKEVAEHFGIGYDWACKICRGVARQDLKAQFKKKDIEDVKAMIKKANPNIEYVDGYKNSDSMVRVRCLICGDVFERSMNPIRHGHKTTCHNCKRIELQLAKEGREEEAKRKRAERHALAIANRPYVLARAKAKQREKIEQRREARRHACPVCGTITTRPKYCSDSCCAKACFDSSKHESIRRTRIKKNIVDRDITLKKLFERDGGVCWICGGTCNYLDYIQTDRAFVAGDWYPSIDHVVPLSKGGLHSWDNVKLAHRICNTKKRDIPYSA